MPPDTPNSLIRICALATGLTLNEVVRIAGIGPKRYKVYQIPKRSGGQRTICHPSRELKALQYVFLRKVICELPVHRAATAYKLGSSIKDNAAAHAASRVIMKFDFENFFPSITAADWAAYVSNMFPQWTEEDISFSSYVLFWGAGGYHPVCLSIGAPTSPLISNALMHKFDSVLTDFTARTGLVYTRYADDITISSHGYIDRYAVISSIAEAIAAVQLPRLRLNPAKTKIASKATSRRVTGLILANNGRLSLGRDRKRLISAMVHRALSDRADDAEVMHIAGLLSFAADVEPDFIIALWNKYGKERVDGLQLRKR